MWIDKEGRHSSKLIRYLRDPLKAFLNLLIITKNDSAHCSIVTNMNSSSNCVTNLAQSTFANYIDPNLTLSSKMIQKICNCYFENSF